MVNPVKGVGGVEDRLVSGDNDMVIVLFGSANKGPPSCREIIRKVTESWLNQQRRDALLKHQKDKTHTPNPPTHYIRDRTSAKSINLLALNETSFRSQVG